ncbi:tetratricopeptide repeat protein [Geomicrobium sp. JSM 1781026]|uniref:tetratricopeptide repeat protein n=1 Tax=Geomicrobium sp. JSM 1781026 TaxID=3344580 RepID=UPI0035C1AB55
MKKHVSALSLTALLLTGCSTLGMDRYIATEQEIDTEKYGYEEDEDFILNESVMNHIAALSREDQLSTRNLQSIFSDEIEAGNYNEFIVFFRDWSNEEPEEAAPFTSDYYNALLSHIESPSPSSQQLIPDAIATFESQYSADPEDDTRLLRYARSLMESGYDVEQGADLVFRWRDNVPDEERGIEGLFTIARAHQLIGDFEESVQTYDQIAELSPDDARIYYLQSQAYREMGDEENAQEAMDLAFSPSRSLLNNYGDNTYDFYLQFLDESSE